MTNLRPLTLAELGAAERLAEAALARCNVVVANPGPQPDNRGRAGGSIVPDLAEAVLRLSHEVKQLRGRTP